MRVARGSRPVALPTGWLTALVIVLLAALVAPPAGARDLTAPDRAPVAAQVRAEIAASGSTDFWVHLAERPDLTAYRDIPDWGDRGQAVYDVLRARAEQSQAGLRAELDARGVDYEAFWVTNAIFVRGGDSLLVDELAASAAVEQILPDVAVTPPVATVDTTPSPAAVEWNVADVHADDLWAQGHRGEGIVIGVLDTGVDYTHPALVAQYRGNNGDGTFSHDYSWFDATGEAPAAPADRQDHGTHVTGILVGDDGVGNQVGVAPGARWVATNGCCPSTAALVAAAQWMLAPTDVSGANPRPDLRPHVINNSWATTSPSTAPFIEDIAEAWAAAGQFAVFAVGNTGPTCESAGSPGSRVINYAVGAYGPSHTIARLSGRGGGQDGTVKPDITAPGEGVRSSVPGGGYGTKGGTSMATPHVSGAVALLWSAAPHLVGAVGPTRVLLDRTAVDTEDLQCGGTAGDNNVFGEGRLDAAALVAAAPPAEGGTTVDRVDGATRYDTAAMIWDDLAPGIDVAYVASGANFPDALAGAARAGSEGAPVLLTRPDRLPAATAAALSRLDPARVVILGGSGAVSEAVLQEIQVTTEGAPVSRVDGVDRYDTAALLAPETPVGTVVVASGEDFPDALAGAARAAHLDAPVLLVRQDEVPSRTAARLAALDPTTILLLGGEVAVSAAVETQLAAYGEVSRVAGPTRFGTAAALSGPLDSATGVWLASGFSWPDALAAAARAGAEGTPLLLTRQATVPVQTWDELGRLDPQTVHVAGGPVAIADEVAERLALLP